MWNFSDDYGVIKGHPTWIKNKVFPYDDIKQSTFNEWLMGLERLRCIIPFDHNGEKFYFIRTFNEHQRVDKPSCPAITRPTSSRTRPRVSLNQVAASTPVFMVSFVRNRSTSSLALGAV